MNYKWEDAATPQGRDRLKELVKQGLQVVCKHDDGTLFRAYTDMQWYIWADGNMFFSWEEFEEDDTFFSFEFLDPSPETVADENGLLKTLNDVFDIIHGVRWHGDKQERIDYAAHVIVKAKDARAGKETSV